MATPGAERRSGGHPWHGKTGAALKNAEKQREWERKDAEKQMWHVNEALGITT